MESIRQLKLKLRNQVLVVHVAYLPLPKTLGELKSKPVQQSVSFLLASGVQPDIIVTRAEKPIDKLRKEKIAVFCNVYQEDIIDNPDLKNVYLVPDYLKKQGIVKLVSRKLGLSKNKPNQILSDDWHRYVKKTVSVKKGPKLAIVGKYFQSGQYALEDSYVCVIESLRQAYAHFQFEPNYSWLNAEEIQKKGTGLLNGFDGIIVPQGWGSRGVEGKILAAGFARERKIPYLGLCFGMQMAAIEFARHVLGLAKANSTEVDPSTPDPIIDLMENQKQYLKTQQYGGTIRLGAWPAKIKTNSKLYEIYQQFGNLNFSLPIVSERHRHRYEFNNRFLAQFESHGFVASAKSPDGKLVEAMEITNHPFFIGVQYHPEYKSRPLAIHPLFLSFIEVASKLKQ